MILQIAFRFRRVSLVGGLLGLASLCAASATQAKDTDVSYVEYNVRAGMIWALTQTGTDTWTDKKIQPQSSRPGEQFQEVSRDAERVCLRMPGPGVREIEINLSADMVFIGCSGRSQQVENGKIRAARSDFFQNKTVGFGRPPTAQATDTTLKLITYTDNYGRPGKWEQAGSTRWVQNDRRMFREVFRDETSVYLIATDAPSERFQIDLSAMAVFYARRVGTQPRRLMTITNHQTGSVWGPR